MENKERIIAYIDGFNLYFGMVESGFDRYKWLNLKKLILKILRPSQTLMEVKYFSSRVSNDPGKSKRQNTYLEALETQDIKLFLGKYQKLAIKCNNCGATRLTFNEKMTDVNIATEILSDGFQEKYDTALLISGDSDLLPPIRTVHNILTPKRVLVVFPPGRKNQTIEQEARGSLSISRKLLSACQFPNQVINKVGYVLSKPQEW